MEKLGPGQHSDGVSLPERKDSGPGRSPNTAQGTKESGFRAVRVRGDGI
jgi:hypothetical protein